MADIFISYSRENRIEAAKLAADLASEGWSVWWDRHLAAGDEYRDDITRELAQARAVIAIWTAASVKSEWVRAEANRARAAGKLIPVKMEDVSYEDIPLPFGEIVTISLKDNEELRKAVVSTLNRPGQPAPAWSQAIASIRRDLLTWFGVFGMVITIFSGLRETIILSEKLRWLVEHWLEVSSKFWQGILSVVHITVPPTVVPALTLGLLLAITAIGIRLSQTFSGMSVKPALSVRYGLLAMLLAAIPILINSSGAPPSFIDLLNSLSSASYGAYIARTAPLEVAKVVAFLLLVAILFFFDIGLPLKWGRVRSPSGKLVYWLYRPPGALEWPADKKRTFRNVLDAFRSHQFGRNLLDRLAAAFLALVIAIIAAISPLWAHGFQVLKELRLRPEGSELASAIYFVDYLLWGSGLVFNSAFLGLAFCFMLVSAQALRRRFRLVVIGLLLLLAANEFFKLLAPIFDGLAA
jgi:TIR domain